MTLKKILASTVAAALAVSSMAVFASAADTYKVGVVFQTSDWNYRDTVDQEEVGIGGEISEDYEDHEFKDVEITKDGSYTASISNLPESAGTFNFIKLSTNIPCTTDDDGNAKSDVQIEITGVKIDGADVAVDAAKIVNENSKQTLAVNLINEWDDNMKGNGAIANGTFSSIEVTFNVTGMGGGDSAPATEGADNSNPTGDVNQTTGDKNSPDTGVEGVAVVAGLAVIAAGAVVVAKKRK